VGKSKQAPALFEILRKQGTASKEQRVSLPRWWRNRTAPPDASSPELADEAEIDGPTDAADPESEPAGTVEDQAAPSGADTWFGASPARTAADVAEHERIAALPRAWQEYVQWRDGRLHFAISPILLAVVGVAMMLALTVSFQLGKRAGAHGVQLAAAGAGPSRDAGPSIDDVRRSEPNPSVLEPGGRTSAGSARLASPAPRPRLPQAPERVAGPESVAHKTETPPATPAARTPGLNYIIVERFHTRLPGVKTMADAKQQAEHAQRWLAERAGLQTVVEKARDGYQLVTTRGFKLPKQKAACNELMERIKSYGAIYNREGHGYLFTCFAKRFD
jgi:hypothetical protein